MTDILGFGNQARPLQFLTFLPAFFFRDPWTYHLWQNVLILLLTAYLIFVTVWRVFRRPWLASLASFTSLLVPSYTPNYFVLWPMEPYTLLGIIGLLYTLLRLVTPDPPSRRTWVFFNFLGLLFAAYAIGIKEVGIALCLAATISALLLARVHHLSLDTLLARAWPTLTAMELAGFLVLWRLFTIPRAYDADGSGGYSIRPRELLNSLLNYAAYFVDAAPYAWIAFAAWVALLWYYKKPRVDSHTSSYARSHLIHAALFFVLAFIMTAVYVPWRVFDVRYLLVASVSFVLASWFVAHALFLTCSFASSLITRWCARSAAIVIVSLILLHTAYTLAVGPFSEGVVRYRFAVAYDDMFRYVASIAPSNANVYFLLDARFPESRENTVHSLNIFYSRPDIRVVFPSKLSSFVTTGLVVVSKYDFPMNYTRMPVHHEARALFVKLIQPNLRLHRLASFIRATPIWYAREEHNAVQYSSFWGIPAFWGLKSGVYRFGWRVYAFEQRYRGPEPAQR